MFNNQGLQNKSNTHELQNKNQPPVSDQPEKAEIFEELSEEDLASIAGGAFKKRRAGRPR